VRKQLLPVYCRELRRECGWPTPDAPVSEEEIEFVWNLHGGIFYQAVREHVYKTKHQRRLHGRRWASRSTTSWPARTVYPQLLARYSPAALVAPPATRRRRAA
jgi:hypothetical protein